jgi:DNA-binding NarL/FixJ family response regulator
MIRVLIGDFGSIVDIALRELLAAHNIEVVGDEYLLVANVIERVTQARPDVVILDLDAADTPALAARITTTFPAVKVITCSSDDPVMRIFPPFHHGESYESELSLATFAAALKS